MLASRRLVAELRAGARVSPAAASGAVCESPAQLRACRRWALTCSLRAEQVGGPQQVQRRLLVGAAHDAAAPGRQRKGRQLGLRVGQGSDGKAWSARACCGCGGMAPHPPRTRFSACLSWAEGGGARIAHHPPDTHTRMHARTHSTTPTPPWRMPTRRRGWPSQRPRQCPPPGPTALCRQRWPTAARTLRRATAARVVSIASAPSGSDFPSAVWLAMGAMGGAPTCKQVERSATLPSNCGPHPVR